MERNPSSRGEAICLQRGAGISAILRDMSGATAERYEVACETSNLALRHTDLSPGAADTLVAAGLASIGRELGGELMRMSAEWSLVGMHAAPEVLNARRLGRVGVKRLAYIEEFYAAAFDVAVGRLRGLAKVRALLVSWAAAHGITDASHIAASVLVWWMNRACPACEGRKWVRAKNSPALTGKICAPCEGRGLVDVPHGAAGRKLATYMDECVEAMTKGMGTRLRA